MLLMKKNINKMKTKLSKKRAISTVLTTVIILVSSVVLASGVVLYGTSLFQSGTQTEAIKVGGVKLWVHDTDTAGVAWGAVSIRNTGDKVVAVDKISIRGTDIPFGQWYADTSVSAAVFQQSLNHTGWVNPAPGTDGPAMIHNGACNLLTTYIAYDPDGSGTSYVLADCVTADAATGPISLNPGDFGIIFFKLNNGTITTLDKGGSTTVSIFAGKAGGPFAVITQGIP